MLIRVRHRLTDILVRPFATTATLPLAQDTPASSIAPRIDTKRLITCKNKDFNVIRSNFRPTLAKFGSIPLASKRWDHRKSKGDFFILHPTDVSVKEVTHSDQATFEGLCVDQNLTLALKDRLAIHAPTPYQCLAIPSLQNHEHAVLAAETGCGKTLAYLLPLVQHLLQLKEHERGRRFNTPLAMILTPGRELATQIASVIQQLVPADALQVETILGGHTKRLMMRPSFNDVDVLVGTMGAISKLVTTGIYRMERVRQVVLDEADTLLDDSFNEKLVHLLRRFPFHKNLVQNLSEDIVGTQLVLVSATMPTNYRELLRPIVDPETIKEIASPHLHHLLRRVPQRFFRMNKSDRPSHLLGIVKAEVAKKRPVLIFSNRTPTADFVSIVLNEAGVECLNMTGDMQVSMREGRFERFQSGQCSVLSTTDIGSRGLDTLQVAHVINFDFPLHIADYIHRCGRVGRTGSRLDAQVTNFISSGRELNLVQRIEHAARTGMPLTNVDANITNIIKKRIMRNMGQV